MTILLVIVHVAVCVMLIAVILLQAGRGQGLTGPSFASGNVQSLFGTRAADFLTKATSVAAISFLFTCIALDYREAQKSRSLLRGPQQTAPLDIEALKKALEKIKTEKGPADKPPANASQPSASVTETSQTPAEKRDGKQTPVTT